MYDAAINQTEISAMNNRQKNSYGLSFLKEKVPVQILKYPFVHNFLQSGVVKHSSSSSIPPPQEANISRYHGGPCNFLNKYQPIMNHTCPKQMIHIVHFF